MKLSSCIDKMVVVTAVRPGPLGGAIIYGVDADELSHKFVANNNAIFRPPAEGEIWTLIGAVENHPKYGSQIRVERGHLDRPSGKIIINHLAHSPAFRKTGIGIKKAKRLWDTFGEGLYAVLSKKEVDKLSLVLTPETALKLAEAWTDQDESPDVISFLAHYGFSVSLANKVRRVWANNTIQKLQGNPYRMLAFAGWRKVDGMAKALGVSNDDPRRLIAAAEAVLYNRLDAKHTVTPHEIAVSEISATLGSNNAAEAEASIEMALSRYAISSFGNGYQPRGAAFMERVISDRFRSMLAGTANNQLNLFSGSLDAIVAESINSFEQNYGIYPTDEQRAGVLMALGNQLSVLTGGAGVGKTTVLRVINDLCERTGVAVIQMALSGRAAQRMREATGRDASTIARFLHGAGDPKAIRRSDPLVIIDESSMLDLPLMFRIIRALPKHARLLLVGDPYQLPPIGFGLVFHVVTDSHSVPKVELRQVHRQSHSTGIPQIAYDVRRGLPPRLPAFDGVAPGVSFIESTGAEIMENLHHVVSRLSGCEDVQVLGITKRGECGVSNMNVSFHGINSVDKEKLDGWNLAEGDPVIYLRNDYERELWNGSLGRIDVINADVERVEDISLSCTFDGNYQVIEYKDLDKISLAYAITVHKAQGSQFQRVIVPVVKSRLLDRTLLYTALTRGVEQVVFIGDLGAFNYAIQAPPKSQERIVGFSI